jgi:hypothetical protein
MEAMPKRLQSVAELYAEYIALREEAKALYDKADAVLKKLVVAWKKDKAARIDDSHRLEIVDKFRGTTKAFAPGFAHRWDLKERALDAE